MKPLSHAYIILAQPYHASLTQKFMNIPYGHDLEFGADFWCNMYVVIIVFALVLRYMDFQG